MTDFTMREGTDYTIKCIVTGFMNALPVNVSTPATIDVVMWKVGSTAANPALIKDTDEVSVSVNPLATSDTTKCCINIQILEADAASLPVGSYRYEVSVLLSGKRQVVYPLSGDIATFDVISSDTWEESVGPWPEP